MYWTGQLQEKVLDKNSMVVIIL